MNRGTYYRRFLTLEEKIESMLASPNERGCRLWIGRKNLHGQTHPAGYATIKIDGHFRKVSRVLWELRHGPIPEGFLVLHRCDCPPCCEETHLFLGDHQTNSDDKVSKNRQAKGHRTLDEAGARRAIQLRSDGLSYAVIGKTLGVSPQAIFHIVKGRNWKHISNEVRP